MQSTDKNLSLFLPDVRSGFNVGSFFRTADGVGVNHIFLAGITPYPPHKEIIKTSLDAEKMVSWSYTIDPLEVISKLKKKNIRIVALENIPNAKNISEFTPTYPLCLVVGNEVDGIAPDILKHTDEVIVIPMKGKKKSFNVSIAGSLALWHIANHGS